jgi:predicted dehydrogenase
VKVGLFGYGHLGKIHEKCLQQTNFDLIGIYDPLFVDQGKVASVQSYPSEAQLIADCDACILASTTSAHFETARQVLRAGKHLFVEKPMTSALNEAIELESMAAASPHLITQVGFVERFNPAFRYIKSSIKSPKFIEVHRLSTFSERGSDVSVVSDLMIHDLDLILNIMPSDVKEIRAHGVSLITSKLDICNVRLEFENKAVANLTASRMSIKRMRKFRIFQEGQYMSLDLEKKEGQLINISDSYAPDTMEIQSGDTKKYLTFKSSGALEGNAIEQELNEFYNCIINNRQSEADFSSALRTSELAHRIEDIAIKSLQV